MTPEQLAALQLIADGVDYGIITSAYGPKEDEDDAERDVGNQPPTK